MVVWFPDGGVAQLPTLYVRRRNSRDTPGIQIIHQLSMKNMKISTITPKISSTVSLFARLKAMRHGLLGRKMLSLPRLRAISFFTMIAPQTQAAPLSTLKSSSFAHPSQRASYQQPRRYPHGIEPVPTNRLREFRYL